MHAAKLEKSARLQKLLKVLSDGKPHSTFEISRKTNGVATHSDVSELRVNLRKKGKNVDCWRSSRIYYYQLVKL